MRTSKTFPFGSSVIQMSLAEFDACINFISASGRDFPYGVLGVREDEVDASAVSGYNSLMDAGAFGLNNDGYPELTDAVPTVSDMIVAMDEAHSVMVIRFFLGRRSMRFYYAHGETTWCLLWRSGNQWFVVSAPLTLEPRLALDALSQVVMRYMGSETIRVSFEWFTIRGSSIMSTEFHSRRSPVLLEERPLNPNLIQDASQEWPATYYTSQFSQREGFLLEVA